MRPASRVRFHQELALELGVGAYTFEVGLAAFDPDTYVQSAVFAYLTSAWATTWSIRNDGTRLFTRVK